MSTIRFGSARNALIEAPGGPPGARGSFNLTFSPGLTTYTFTVRRVVPEQSVYVPFVVVDACGDWSTFVGGGPTSF